MNESLALALAWAAGVLLGGVFFGGLWLTVRRGISSPRPAVWFLGSLLVRMGITFAGFYLIGGGDWKRLVAAPVGFVMARLVVTWLTRARGPRRHHSGQGGRHAPQS